MDFTEYAIGDYVMLDKKFGGKYAGKIGKVLSIKATISCRNGFGVVTDLYKSRLSSGWYTKVGDGEPAPNKSTETRLLICPPESNQAFFYFG